MHHVFPFHQLDFANFASQPIIMEICKEFRVEWESVVFSGVNENVGEVRGEEELAHHVVGNDSGMCKVVTHTTTHTTHKHTHNKAQLHHAGLFPNGIVSSMTPSAPFEKSKQSGLTN